MTGWFKWPPRERRLRFLAAAGLSAVLAAPVATPASAQDSGRMGALMNKIDRLQGELNDLQRAVYKGKVPAETGDSAGAETAAAKSGAAQGMQPMTQAAGRRMRQRIGTLENELRDLTAQVQQTQHQLDQMAKRLDKLVKDVDYRLKQLEAFQKETAKRLDKLASGSAGGSGAADTADSGSGGGRGAQSGDAQGQQAAGPAGGGATGNGESGTGTLGTVSQAAVAELREEAGGEGAGTDESGGNAGDGTQSASKSGGAGPLPDTAPKKQYDAAFKLLQEREFDKAETALRAFLDKHPEHDLAGNAKYWLGETYYVRGNYNKAAVVFAEGFRTYPDSRKAPDNLLKLGITLGEIDKVDKACRLFSELQSRFPDAPKNILRRAKTEQAELGCEGD